MATELSVSTINALKKLFLNSYNFQKSFLGSAEVALSTYVTQSFKKLQATDRNEDDTFRWEIQSLRRPCVYPATAFEDGKENLTKDVLDIRSLSDVLYQRLMDENDSVPCLVVLGDSGMGKTTLALSVMHKIWREDRIHVRLPIYIHLPAEFSYLKDVNLKTFLIRNHFSEVAVKEILHQPLIVFLDGFDEFNTSGNIFDQISSDLPGTHIKIVILSRLDELPSDRSSRAKLFQPTGRPFDEYVLEPFDYTKINEYICKFTDTVRDLCLQDVKGTLWELAKTTVEGTEWIANPEMYTVWMDNIVELKNLARNPFLLSLILLTLPQIVQSQESKQSHVRKICCTRVGIFDSFTDNWFNFQAQKLVNAEVPFAKFGIPIIQRYFRAYAQNVAHNLIQDNGLLSDNAIQVSTINDIIFLQPAYDTDLLRHYEQHKDFLEECDAISAVRKGCLTQFRENEFRFFHKSLAEYFAARELFDGIQGEFNYHVSKIVNLNKHPGLNRKIIKDKQLLLQLAERVNLENDFCETLYTIIRKSSEFSIIAMMSSNAITILNLAGKSFSGENFRYVQIPRANLSHSLCGNTDFRGANLARVQFHESWLVNSKFQGAQMLDVEFGENQAINNTYIVFNVLPYTNHRCEQLLVTGSVPAWTPLDDLVTAFHFLVTFWKLSTGKIKKLFDHKEKQEFKPHFQLCANDILVTCGNIVKLHSIKSGTILSTISFLNDPFMNAFLDFNLSWICCVEEKTFRIHKISNNFQVEKHASYLYVQRAVDFLPLKISRIQFGAKSEKFVICMNRVIKVLAFPKHGNRMIEICCNEFHPTTAIEIDTEEKFCCLGGVQSIGVLDMSTGEIIEEVKRAHNNQINCLKFNHDSTLLASGSDDSSVKIWKYDVATGKNFEVLKHFPGFQNVVTSLAFCGNNDSTLATVMLGDKRVKLLNVAKGANSPFIGAKFENRFISWQSILNGSSPYLAILSFGEEVYGGLVEVFDMTNGRIICKFPRKITNRALYLHILSNSAILIIDKSKDFNVHIYNECGEIISETYIYVKKDSIANETAIRLNDDQKLLAWTLEDGSIQLFDISFVLSGTESSISFMKKKVLQTEEFDIEETDRVRNVMHLRFSKSGKLFGTSSWRTPDHIGDIGIIRIWNISTGQMIQKIECDCYIHINFFSNFFVASGVLNGKIKFMNIDASEPQNSASTITGLGYDMISFDISEELNLLVAIADYQEMLKTLRIYDLTSHQLLTQVPLWFYASTVFIRPNKNSEHNSSYLKGYVIVTQPGEQHDANIACVELTLMSDNSWSWKLLWGSLSKCVLLMTDLQMEQSFLLSEQNQSILAIYGANGIAAPHQYPFISRPLVFRPLIGTSFSQSKESLIKLNTSKQVNLDMNKWAVTAAISQRRFQVPHVFLILEGICANRRFLVRADLTYNKDLKQIFILTSPKKMDFIERVKHMKGNQWIISPNQGIQLLQNIMEDKQRRLTNYTVEKHNCVNWARSHLQSIGITFDKRWYNSVLILPSNILK